MAEPLDAVTAIHNAFRRDVDGIDAAALDAARGRPALAPAVERFRFLIEVLVWHAQGEELAIFPAIEDAHLYRLIRERVPVPEQGKAVGIMASTVPQDRFPEVVAWMFPLLGHDDRQNMTRIWQMVMPPPAFARAKQLIQEAIGNDWAELARRIPTLA